MFQITEKREDNKLTITLNGRIDSANAAEAATANIAAINFFMTRIIPKLPSRSKCPAGATVRASTATLRPRGMGTGTLRDSRLHRV